MSPAKKRYRWFYGQVQSRYYDLLMKWCSLPFGGEEKWRDELLRPVAFAPTDRILDVGCGTGNATFTIASRAGGEARITGMDLSQGQLRRAKAKNAHANVTFVQGDATRMCFPDGCFDKVFITHAIHEMQRMDRLSALAEASRVLKERGTLVVLELDKPDSLFLRLFVGFWFCYWLPFNLETPTRRDMFRRGLSNEVKEAGFEDVKRTAFLHGVFQVVQGTKGGRRAVH